MFGLSYRFSKKMLKTAEKEGVTHAVVGYSHAEDFVTHDPASPAPMMLGSAVGKAAKTTDRIAWRQTAYKKHAQFIERLYQIAAKHSPPE